MLNIVIPSVELWDEKNKYLKGVRESNNGYKGTKNTVRAFFGFSC